MMHYAAIDIGTTNCRLLIAKPGDDNTPIVTDSYVDAVFLGENLYHDGVIPEAAIARGIDALLVCAEKMREYPSLHYRAIATEVCRIAKNGQEFVAQAKKRTGIDIDIISHDEESRLACVSCLPLIRQTSDDCIIFEIGGGSIQVSLLHNDSGRFERQASISIPLGIVTACARWGTGIINDEILADIISECRPALEQFSRDNHIFERIDSGSRMQLISASSIPVTLACLHLKMTRYLRHKIDGRRFVRDDIIASAQKLRRQDIQSRSTYPIIGEARMQMAAVGAALTEAILRQWPIPHIDIADRGQREGLLRDMLERHTRWQN